MNEALEFGGEFGKQLGASHYEVERPAFADSWLSRGVLMSDNSGVEQWKWDGFGGQVVTASITAGTRVCLTSRFVSFCVVCDSVRLLHRLRCSIEALPALSKPNKTALASQGGDPLC